MTQSTNNTLFARLLRPQASQPANISTAPLTPDMLAAQRRRAGKNFPSPHPDRAGGRDPPKLFRVEAEEEEVLVEKGRGRLGVA
jgi:hypothetical protein